MFVDKVEIYVKAGRGGNGCNSFHKLRGSRYKRPDGGDGGKGGDVYIKGNSNINTLIDFYYKKKFAAFSGKHGSGNKKRGRDGKSIVLEVPLGTIIKDIEKGKIIEDICTEGNKFLLARGGRGGRGNAVKNIADPGGKGEELKLELKLKLIADIALVGFPNVGKSTFIRRVTNANSKVANYPFTTKTPILGVVSNLKSDFVIADIPGLIKGANKGKGLGDKFLRHIERTKVLILMIDVSKNNIHPPLFSYFNIINELKLFKQDLISKPRVIALTKEDQVGPDFNFSKFSNSVEEKHIYSISSITGFGINQLLLKIKELLEKEKNV